MLIGQKIKELRISNNLTQEQLAELLCISFQAVSKWETNVSTPDISMIAPLTKIFHVSADELLCLKPGVYKYSSQWFNRIETDTHEWLGSKGTRMCDDMKQYLEDSQFDLIRSDMRFMQLYNRLS